jgi:hypothetical protein
MLPVDSPISILVSQAVDSDHTPAERAAAMNVASRMASEAGVTIDLPEPPPGWAWRDGRVVPVEASGIVPPLRIRGPHDRWDSREFDEPAADNDNDEPATVPEQPAVEEKAAEVPEPMPVPAVEPGRPTGTTGRRPGSKVATIIRLTRRSTGATTEELLAATGSSPKSLRAMVYMLKRDGEDITFDRKSGRYIRAA